MPTIKLSDLLQQWITVSVESDCLISGLSLDSRQVKQGDLFFACQGVTLNGRQFIADAIAKGAHAVLAEAGTDAQSFCVQNNVPVFSVANLNKLVGKIAATFFGHPALSLRVIGITGTNGKTSCSHFIAAALQQLTIPCGVIGTLGVGLSGHLQPGSLTTPDAITLQATFADFVQRGARAVAMEVSSHSIDQGRVNGIPFEIGVFTNLSRDHLDYHGSMEAYGAVKKRLFDNPFLQHAVINADDAFGQELMQSLFANKSVFAYSVRPQPETSVPIVYADNVKLDITGIRAEVFTPWGNGELTASLIGQFNLSNLLAVLTVLCVMGVPFREALRVLAELKPVSGRMQTLGGGHQPLVVVDYAHTPDALEKTLAALKQHCQGKLYCIFGCGGDRDKGKRPMMAQIGEQYADRVIVTDDNPRHEDPKQIVADIMRGFQHPADVIVQHDRSKAIQDIIQCANEGDCILIAGKGAETYQQIGDEKIPFSDVAKVHESLFSSPLTEKG